MGAGAELPMGLRIRCGRLGGEGRQSMAGIENCTLSFGARRPRCAGLTCAARRLAVTEIELRLRLAGADGLDGGR